MNKKKTVHFLNGQDLNRHFTKDNIPVANNHMKRCSVSSLLREIQNKSTLTFPLDH